MYLSVLSSGEMGGTTMTEMRREWSISDLFDALDHITYLRALAHAHSKVK